MALAMSRTPSRDRGLDVGAIALRPLALGAVGTIAVISVLVLMIAPKFRFGAILGVLVVGGANALPGPDLTTHSHGGLTYQDACVALLCLAMFVDLLRQNLRPLLNLTMPRVMLGSSLTLLGWFTFTLYRTDISYDQPLLRAANYGVDFVTYACMIPLFAGVFQRRDVRTGMLVVVGLFTCEQAFLYIIATLVGDLPSVLLHVYLSRVSNGIHRLYSTETDLFHAAAFVGMGTVLFASDRRAQFLGGTTAALCLVALLATQTRAIYIGDAGGAILSLVVWLTRSGPNTHRARGRLLRGAVGGIAIAAALVLSVPQISSVVNASLTRLGSSVSTVQSSSTQNSTIAVRQQEARDIDQAIGSQWLLGRGLLDPSYQPAFPARDGALRNSDVGILNVVATMGIVGAAIYYFPLVAVTLVLLIPAQRRLEDDDIWIRVAVMGWAIATAISSITLITMFSPTGVVTCALMLGLGAAAARRPQPLRMVRSAASLVSEAL
jgi:hypothetical protein